MEGTRKGLIAPQNIFLETILRRFNSPQTAVLIANARIVDYPIVFVNDNFTRMTGYTRRDMMQSGAICKQLHGERTSINAVERIQRALNEGTMEQVEMTLYKKTRTMIWVIMCVAPIENDAAEVLLYLVLFYDISLLRQPMEDDALRGSFSKFARLARSVAKNRSPIAVQPGALDESLANLAPLQASAIPKYRQESPKTPPHVLLHYVTFRIAWDWMIFVLTGYTSLIVPYSVAFGYELVEGAYIISIVDRVVDAIFLVDIVLNFHTTFVGPTGAVISDPALIRLNYVRGWFLVDLLGCLPYGLLNMFNAHEMNSNLTNLLNALRIGRLLRLWRVIRKLDQYLKYVATILLIMIFCFILLAHWLACVWYMVGVHDINSRVYHGWIVHLINETTGRQNGTVLEPIEQNLPPKAMLYMTSLYFTLSLITSIGFGNVAANTTIEKIVSVLFMIIGALVYATIFGNVTTILQQTHAARARLRQMMANVKDFLRIHNVPKELSERVIDYVTSTWSLTRGVDADTVLNNCPKDMKADLCVHLYREVFTEHAAFRLASESCLRALAVAFTTQHTAPGDLIFHQGESIDQLCFVVSGSLEVVQDDEVVAILSKGDTFGQPVWKESDVGQSAASVRALTYCDLHCIKRERLLEVLKFYSAFANSFSRSLVLTYNLRNRLVFRKISDVERERKLSELRRNQPPLSSLAPDHPVRRLISRFCNAASPTSGRSDSVSQGEGKIQQPRNEPEEGQVSQVTPPVRDSQTKSDGNKDTTTTTDKLVDENCRRADMIGKMQDELIQRMQDMRTGFLDNMRTVTQRLKEIEDRVTRLSS